MKKTSFNNVMRLLAFTLVTLSIACKQNAQESQQRGQGTNQEVTEKANQVSPQNASNLLKPSQATHQPETIATQVKATGVLGARDSGASDKKSEIIAQLKQEFPAPQKVARPLSSKPPQQRVIAKGYADPTLPNPEQAAVEDALRKAVKHVGGMQLGSMAESRNFSLVQDVIVTRSTGYISKHQILKKTEMNLDGLYEVQVEAVVSKGSIDFEVELFKSAIRRMGTPEVMLLRTVDEARLPPQVLTLMQEKLKSKGIRVIDPDMSLLNRAKAARRAGKVDQDMVKAALISDQFPCDIVGLINFEGDTRPSVPMDNVLKFPTRANCSIRLIRVDSAEPLANATAEITAYHQSMSGSEQLAAKMASEKAMNLAIEKIARHWLEELNDNGHWIKLTTHKFSFDRTMSLTSQLKTIPAIMEVQNKNIDEEATGEMRLRTALRTENIGMIIKRLDRNIKIKNMTRFGLNIR